MCGQRSLSLNMDVGSVAAWSGPARRARSAVDGMLRYQPKRCYPTKSL
jgi:hypothetical protein